MYIKIENKGELDIPGLFLVGASSKRDEDKIGFFGSGNKYAMATLLRKGIKFKIFSGKKEVKITTKPVIFRGKLFEQIFVDGKETSLTTDMGVDWETWFAIREFYSNALDEGGAKLSVEKKVWGKKGTTRIFIQFVKEIKDIFKNIEDYFYLNKERTIFSGDTGYCNGEILKKEKNKPLIVYRKGIRVSNFSKEESLYDYNFEDLEINESRIFKEEYQVKERIASLLAICDKFEIIENFVYNHIGNYEENLIWGKIYVEKTFSDVWYEVLKEKIIYPKTIALQYGDVDISHSDCVVLPDDLCERLNEEFPELDIKGFENKSYIVVEDITEKEKDRLVKLLNDLRKMGFKVGVPVKLMYHKVKTVRAMYSPKLNTIFLERGFFNKLCDDELLSILLEEYYHSIGFLDDRSLIGKLCVEIIFLKSLLVKKEI